MADYSAPPSPSSSREHAAIAMRLALMVSDDEEEDCQDQRTFVPGYFDRGERLLKGLHNRVQKLTDLNKWEHGSAEDGSMCHTCVKKSVGINKQLDLKVKSQCLGLEWLCKAREYITSTHTITIPHQLMTKEEYFKEAKFILEKYTIVKGWKFLTQWHTNLVKAQPQLKPVCDNMEVSTFWEGYLVHFEEHNNRLCLPVLGEEILPMQGKYTLLHREEVAWKSDPAYTGHSAPHTEDIDVSMGECGDPSEGWDEPDGRLSPKPVSSKLKVDHFLGVSIDLGDSKRGLKLFFGADDNPCSFCKRLSKQTKEWVNCSGCERVCFAKYKLGKERLPFLNTNGDLMRALVQCVELKGYQQWMNNIFTHYDINKSIETMVGFNNHLLQCSPHMKKYIVIYEAVIHKSWGCVTHMKRNVF